MSLPFPIKDRYYRYSYFLKKKFGTKVYKIGVDAGFTCPTRDGTLGTRGCLYCNNLSFSVDRREGLKPLREQIIESIEKLKEKKKANRFLVYFQAYTNTYAPVEKLEELYAEALSFRDVVGLCIGTRPDCVNDRIFGMLSELNRDYFISIEYGVESVYDRNLDWAQRGHDFKTSVRAIEEAKRYGLDVAVHIIFGFPGESKQDILLSADKINVLPVDSIKIHNLHVVRNTPLEEYYRSRPFKLFSEEEWVETVVDFLERLRPDIVVQRLIGEAKNDTLVAPVWERSKSWVLSRIKDELVRRGTFQGYRYFH